MENTLYRDIRRWKSSATVKFLKTTAALAKPVRIVPKLFRLCTFYIVLIVIDDLTDGIVKYMRAQVGPSSKDLKSLKDFEDFVAKDEVAVVGFFEKETDLKGSFLKLADKLREKVRFAHSSLPQVLKAIDQTLVYAFLNVI